MKHIYKTSRSWGKNTLMCDKSTILSFGILHWVSRALLQITFTAHSVLWYLRVHSSQPENKTGYMWLERNTNNIPFKQWPRQIQWKEHYSLSKSNVGITNTFHTSAGFVYHGRRRNSLKVCTRPVEKIIYRNVSATVSKWLSYVRNICRAVMFMLQWKESYKTPWKIASQ